MKDTGEFENEGGIRKFSFRGAGRALREKAWLIALCAFAGLFIGLGYAARQAAIFRSIAVIEIMADETNPLKSDDPRAQDTGQQEVVATIVANFRSRAFLKNVVEKHGLRSCPAFAGGAGELSTEEAIDRVLGSTRVEIRKGPRLIDITGEFSDPQTAQRLAQSLADEFLATLMEQRASTSRLAVKYLVDEAANLKAKLQHSEEALQTYKELHGSLLVEEKQEALVAKLKTQKAQLTEAKAVRLRLEADYLKAMEHAGDVRELLGIAAVSEHPSVLECKQQITSLEVRIAELSLRYPDKHPKNLQVRAQLLDAREALRAAVLKMPELIRASYEEAVVTEKSFEAALKEQENAALLLNRQALPYNVLFRDVETDRALYEAILKRLREADIARGVELTNLRVFEPAILPSEPVGPSRVKLSMLGLLGGLLVGAALSLGLGLYRGVPSRKSVE